MKRKARRPRSLLLVLLPWLLAPVGGWAAWQALHAPPPTVAELASLLGAAPPRTFTAAAEEKQWLADAFREKDLYLPAPPVLSPCLYSLADVDLAHAPEVRAAVRDGDVAGLQEIHRKDGNWLTGLALGNLQARQGRIAEAAQLFDRLLSRFRGRRTRVEEAQVAARSGQLWDGPGTGELTTLIYLLQASGYVKIKNQQMGDDDLWWTLKSPIAGGKLIYAREGGLLVDKVIDGYELSLPLHCTAADRLSSYDLYNNLIVGYLKVLGFQGRPDRRTEEFSRTYTDPPAENPLQALLRQEVPTIAKEPARESWVWAVSNAERLLRDRLREKRGLPQNARLALNLAGLLESAVERTPPDARDALLREQSDLLAVANAQRWQLTDAGERKIFDQALVRLNLLAAGRQPRPFPTPAAAFAALAPDQQRSADLVHRAQSQRRLPARWVELAAADNDVELERFGLRLGPRKLPWLAALRQDLAATVASRADGLEPAEQSRLAQVSGALLRLRDPTPPELDRLRSRLGGSARLESWLRSPWGALVVAVLAAAFVWYVIHWLAVQLQLRRELFTSFYRVEAEQRLRSLR